MTVLHGTMSRYNYGCRCTDCRTASAAARANQRYRRKHGLPPLKRGAKPHAQT